MRECNKNKLKNTYLHDPSKGLSDTDLVFIKLTNDNL